MKKDILALLVGDTSLSIVEAMNKIDANSKGVLFIVDSNKKLVGSLTDGDIRRWIMHSGAISEKVTRAMNTNPKFLTFDDADYASSFMKDNSITAIPLVNNDNQIIDIFTLSDKER